MKDVFILGAGFSKAVSDYMPTMAELGVEVIQRLEQAAEEEGSEIYIPRVLYDLGNVESWMTYLSQPQPWLREETYHRHLALARDIRRRIREVIAEGKAAAMQEVLPTWLHTLIRQWHSRQVSVITLNYDTIIESACREPVTEDSREIFPMEVYPPYFAGIRSRSGGGFFGSTKLETFTYFKLHGSANWYYSGRDDFYGETIFVTNVPPWEAGCSQEERNPPPAAGDKDCLIIPPVTDKLTYFNNETIRRLWQEAHEALKSASRIFIIGYSLPLSDLGMRFFLQDGQPSEATEALVYIVDRKEEVVGRYKKLLPRQNIIGEFSGGETVVADFAQHYSDTL